MRGKDVLPYTKPPTSPPPPPHRVATSAGKVRSVKSFQSKQCRRRALSCLPILPPITISLLSFSMPSCRSNPDILPSLVTISVASSSTCTHWVIARSGCRSAFLPTRDLPAFLPRMTWERMRRRVCCGVEVGGCEGEGVWGMNWRSMVVVWVRGRVGGWAWGKVWVCW